MDVPSLLPLYVNLTSGIPTRYSTTDSRSYLQNNSKLQCVYTHVKMTNLTAYYYPTTLYATCVHTWNWYACILKIQFFSQHVINVCMTSDNRDTPLLTSYPFTKKVEHSVLNSHSSPIEWGIDMTINIFKWQPL